MEKYYVAKTTKNPGSNHEVHKAGCVYLPQIENRFYLGEFSNCQDAVREAKKYYDNVDGCYTCCRPCHKG